MKTPDNFSSWNRAMRGAYARGYRDSMAGVPIHQCPYQDTRKWDNRITWSRAFARAWEDGWQAAREDDPINTGKTIAEAINRATAYRIAKALNAQNQ